MQDRQDIDALLMGALYGELSPAETARLEEHLAAHPQDRLVLDGLGRARQAIRDSDILAFQVEPPAAVSALLLQEAARRAPAARSERKGALARFFAGFLVVTRHPAMAAAALVVLVVGIASTLYVQNDGQLGAPEPEVANEAPSAAPPPVATAGEPGYRADLDVEPLEIQKAQQDEQAQGGDEDREELAKDTARFDEKSDSSVAKKKVKPSDRAPAFADQTAAGDDMIAESVTRAGKEAERAGKIKGGIVVTTPEPTIKGDTPEPEGNFARAPTEPAPSTLSLDTRAATGSRSANAFDMSAAGQAPESDQAAGLAAAPPAAADRGRVGGGGGGDAGVAGKPADRPGMRGKAAPGKAAASKPAQTVAAPADMAAPATKNDAAARELHRRLVALVKANKCDLAGKAGAELYARYPDYYAEYVRNDRDVKACRPHIEKENKKRQIERAKSRMQTDSYEAEAPSPSSVK